MSDNSFSLRPEAGPIPYWKHHKRAQESINFIIRVIKAAADRVKESEGISGDPSLDTNRASRICFVSGEPGSGKSTLYLTLRAMLTKKENIYSEGYPTNEKNLSNLQGKVKLLDPLDLEVAGNERENLLAAVLVRLFRKLDPPSSNINSKNCEDAIKELEELSTDIGIAWDGNLQARAGALDPDTYSGEVMRTQSARLRVNERLRDSLTKIAKEGCFDCTEETLFVLPVDDLYLNPNASLQLLRLLRMISIPRLFFLIMGDINTVEALFIEKSLADWTGVAGNILFVNRQDRFEAALTRATELRARYLRKLLPPGQRTTIEAMDWYEALNLEVDLPTGNEKVGEVLEELLVKVELDEKLDGGKSRFTSLLSFLISPPLTSFDSTKMPSEKKNRADRAKGVYDTNPLDELSLDREELRKYRSAYTAVQIFDATPREIMDVASALREVILKKPTQSKKTPEERIPELLSSITDIVNLVREENSFLNSKQQEILEKVLPTRVYSPEDINLKTDQLELRQVARTWKSQIEKNAWIRNHRSWNLGPLSVNKEIDNNPYAKLPPRPAAWFILLHDIAWEWSHDSITVNLVNKLCQELNTGNLPTSEDGKPLSGWAFGLTGSGYKHFPIPEFNTFRDLDRFLFVWSRGLEWLDEQRRLINEAQKEYLEANDELAVAENEFNATKSNAAQKRSDESIQKESKLKTARQNAGQKQKQYNEAQEIVGVSESDQFKKLIHLWGLAVSTILDEPDELYKDFAMKDSKIDDWFYLNLLDFDIDRYKKHLSTDCQKTLEDLLTHTR